jgi:arylformamidase
MRPPVRLLGPPLDATVEIHADMAVFPGDPSPRLVRTASFERGDPLLMSELHLGCHVGTHVDAPGHFVAGGSLMGEFSPEMLSGRVVVLDCTSAERAVQPGDLPLAALGHGDHVVLRTANTLRRGDKDGLVHVTVDAIHQLISTGITVLGFDSYSLDAPEDHELPAHRSAALSGIPVVVMLDLRLVQPGEYFWAVAPLRLRNAEAAPARVLFFPAQFA